ncbi:MAG TPA: hypothetical protein VHQ70_01655 [Syntrophomonadaceae bacterium]|nr:hypothetical protein [Syntrophomonadaceae bacterium]
MKRIYLCLLIILLVITTIIYPSAPVSAQTKPDNNGKVYMAVVDSLSITDFNKKDTLNLYLLTQKGSIGLSSSRTLRGQNNYDCSLTIGAGNLARAYTNGIIGYNNDELVVTRNQTAIHLYKNLTSFKPGKSACLLINLPEIITGMSTEKVATLPGAMGENLRRSHRTVCLLGNGDIFSS